jgi:hypothetical protein
MNEEYIERMPSSHVRERDKERDREREIKRER